MEDPFVLPGDAAGRTEDGAVWVRWANVGSYSGWYAVGTRAPAPRGSFWSRTYALATEVGNGSVDGVHAIGPGVLALGGIGVTMASGMAQDLMHMCLERHAIRWMECMAPVLALPDALRVLGFTREDPMADLDLVVRANKDHARAWVESCSHMLRDSRFDEVQEDFLAQRGPEIVGTELCRRIGFARTRDTWSWSQEQQAVWALAVVMALSDQEAADAVLAGALLGGEWSKLYPEANGEAHATLLALREAARVLAARGVPEHFVSRLERVLRLLPKFFQVGSLG